jgi:hypothetical protein
VADITFFGRHKALRNPAMAWRCPCRRHAPWS